METLQDDLFWNDSELFSEACNDIYFHPSLTHETCQEFQVDHSLWDDDLFLLNAEQNGLACNAVAPDPCSEIDQASFHNVTDSFNTLESAVTDMTLFADNGSKSPRIPSNISNSNGLRRGRTKIADSAKRTLMTFFEKSKYPSETDLLQLVSDTGLDEKTIRCWFNNTRARSVQMHGPDEVDERDPMFATMHVTEANLETLAKSHTDEEHNSNFALDRFFQTPLEQDPCITYVLSRTLLLQQLQTMESRSFKPDSREQDTMSRCSSRSSAGSLGGVSVQSGASVQSVDFRSRRKGRRRHQKAGPQSHSPATDSGYSSAHAASYEIGPADPRYMLRTKVPFDAITYFCTFCARDFKDSYDWERHERTVHVANTIYVCNPLDADLKSFMGKRFNYDKCRGKPFHQRVFFRKDHLSQHVRRGHYQFGNNLELRRLLETHFLNQGRKLRIPNGHAALHCGFCGEDFDTWEARTKHVLAHYNQGATLDEWWLSRVSHKLQDSGSPTTNHEGQDFSASPSTSSPSSFWSCANLTGIRDAFPKSGTWTSCLYCGRSFGPDDDDWTERLLHLVQKHQYRTCAQRAYDKLSEFVNHFYEDHNSIHDGIIYKHDLFRGSRGIGSSDRQEPGGERPFGQQ